jgi:hypothetical protein
VEVELLALRIMEEVIVGVAVMKVIGHDESTEETELAIADERIARMADAMVFSFENMLTEISKVSKWLE